MQSSEDRSPTSDPRPTARRAWLLPLILVVLVGGALAFRVASLRPLPKPDPLHGNSEEAPGALETRLSTIPTGDRLPLLVKYTRDPSAGLRYAAVDALGKYHDALAADAVEQAFHDSDSETRKRAMEVLWDIDEGRGLKQLLIGLRDADPWMREDAATQIEGRIGRKPSGVDGRVVPMMILALDDTDDDVVSTALTALRKLTGQLWRVARIAPKEKRQQVVERWKQWWAGARATWPAAPGFTDLQAGLQTRADVCPDFHLDRFDGKELSLTGQQGRITLLNFWGMGCGPCIAEMPDFVEVYRSYKGRNVDVIGVAAAGDDAAKVQKWCADNGVIYPQAQANAEALHAFGDIEDVPVTVLIDAKGRIRYTWQGGPRGPAVYHAAIDRLLSEARS